MIKERETYTATKGVENEGYEFEIAMLSFYCLHLCYNNQIKDFKIALYDDEYHPFDDIVIDITTQVTEKYAIQLKHVKDKLQLNSNHFGKNGKMVLSKYFRFDFTKSDHVVLLTNGVVSEEMTVGGCQIKAKNSISFLEQSLDTSSESNQHIYEISTDGTCSKITFFTSQRNRNDIDLTIRGKFKEKFNLDGKNLDGVVYKFKNFFQLWKKGYYNLCKLDKEDIKMKLAEILLWDSIVTYQPTFSEEIEEKVVLLQKVIKNFNVTLIGEVPNGTIDTLCRFNLNKQELIESGQELLVEGENLVIILWRLKYFPLVVRIDDGNRNIIYELIGDIKDENLNLILMGDPPCDLPKGTKILTVLEDLKDEDGYSTLISTFQLSIQGHNAVTFKTLLTINPKFGQVITFKELVLALNGLNIGEALEVLPQPYIPRRFLTPILKTKTIELFPNDLFAIKGPTGLLQKILPKNQYWNFEDFLKNLSLETKLPPKSIILCDDTTQFSWCLKYKNSNVHCLKVLDQNHLQVLSSKEKTDKLRQYQVFPESDLYDLTKSKINLICARPGMGKLTMLKYLRNNSPPGYWTVKVGVQEEEIKNTGDAFGANVKQSLQEVNRLIFFFYGIDKKRIEALAKRGHKIWVFSEDHLKETLEGVFGVASMDIEEFTEEEQQQYIQERLKKQVNQLEKVLISFKMLRNNDILGVPMHLYMLTEIFIKNPHIKEVFVLTDIYRYFIKTKYQHYLCKGSSEGTNQVIKNDILSKVSSEGTNQIIKVSSESTNQIIEDGIYYRNEQYKLAAISCLHFKKLNVQCDNHFLNQIKKRGDVVGIIFKINTDGGIIFSQQTYADYFAALWLADNYQKIDNLSHFVHREEFRNIFFMFNLEVCKNNPAHIAVLYQNCEILVKHRGNFNDVDPLGRSLLHLACSNGTKEKNSIVELLIGSTDLDPLICDNLFGWNLYDYAFNMSNLFAVEKLLSKYQHTEETVIKKLVLLSEELFSIIHYSVKFGYENLVKATSKTPSFCEHLSMVDCNGETLLYLAVKSGSCLIVNLLLDKGAKIDTPVSTYNKRSPLHRAVENGNQPIMELLLKRQALVDIMDRYRNTPLHLAASKGKPHLVKTLLDYGADVNFADNFGRTPLQLAATHGHTQVAKLLLDTGAKIDKSDKFGNTPMSCAVDKKQYKVCQLLESMGAKNDTGTMRKTSTSEFQEYTDFPLHWAAITGQLERIDPLLKEGWAINAVDNYGKTPLHKAVIEKFQKVVEVLLERGADVNIADNNEIVPLCRSIDNDDLEMTKILLIKYPSVDIKDKFNYTPLHWATMRGNPKIVTLLLTKNPDVDLVDDFNRKPIDCAMENGHLSVVTLLDEPTSPRINLTEKMAQFLHFYDNIGQNDFPSTPLSRAIVEEQEVLVRGCLKNGTDVSIKSTNGSTILHLAAYKGNRVIVSLLVRFGVTIEADTFGFTPLHVAAMEGHFEVLSVLISAGGDADAVDMFGSTALDWACRKGRVECVKVLIDKGGKGGRVQGGYLEAAKKQSDFVRVLSSY